VAEWQLHRSFLPIAWFCGGFFPQDKLLKSVSYCGRALWQILTVMLFHVISAGNRLICMALDCQFSEELPILPVRFEGDKSSYLKDT